MVVKKSWSVVQLTTAFNNNTQKHRYWPGSLGTVYAIRVGIFFIARMTRLCKLCSVADRLNYINKLDFLVAYP
jgi:hypothetical protein